MTRYLSTEVSSRHRNTSMFLVLVGIAGVTYGLTSAPARTWPSLLLNGFYITSLAVSAAFFLAAQRVTGARWSAGLRRIPEAFMLALPATSVLLLAVFLGRENLYPWSRPDVFAHTPDFAGKIHYLQTPWVFGRMATVLLIWSGFALLFRRASLNQDRNPGMSLIFHQRLTRYAVWFLPIFALTFTLAAFDWLISLEPEWFSTMFAIYVFAGTFVQGIAAITLATVLLQDSGTFTDSAGKDQLHDLGKLLFAFSTFWGYIWVCQYLLIWYGNIPEEVTHYVKRTNGLWLYLFLLNFAVNWVTPFVALLSARAKRTPKMLKAMCILLLCGHWLDLYLLIMPTVSASPKIGFLEVLIAVGYVAFLYRIFIGNLARAPLAPVNDPVLAADSYARHTYESSHLHPVLGAES